MEIDNKAPAEGPMIYFGLVDLEGVHLPHNDVLFISATIANYIVQRHFVDSGSSPDVLFYNVYQQMELGDVLLEPVDTSLYGFAGKVVHPLGQISLPLSLGSKPAWRTKMIHFLVVDMRIDPSVVVHSLNIDPAFPPVKQKKRHLRPEKDNIIHEELGRNMEVYADDMLVKSKQMDQHLADLAETFNTLKKYHMKLNSAEYAFWSLVGYQTQALAEFINEATFTKGNGCNYLLDVDGASTLTGIGVGVVLTSPKGDELEYALRFDYKASNNETEYEAIIAEGEYEVEKERMKEYLREIGELTSRLKNFQLHQIPGTENAKANYLARLPSSLIGCSTCNITVRTLVKNSLKTDIATLQVETDWRKPLLDYLTEGILPANEMEAVHLKSTIARLGLPRVIISDNDHQFQGWKIQDWCVEHGIQQHFTFVAYSQANEQVEIINRILVQGIKTRLMQAGGQWVDALQGVLWSYKSTPRSTTGETKRSWKLSESSIMSKRTITTCYEPI
ncbi:UNVERIFIED_CONTAM: hypothetical protein Slati_3435800 [Sesamum latifolium]|uniref:Integrase catalytic domain-containing protein n=1 Tax=Sesamum latifolium TaxID=2727402 RepID=A0AAW2UGH2_9LAMI